MFGLQWIDRKYIAINSNTTPISDRFTCQKEVEFVILSAIFLPFSDLNTLSLIPQHYYKYNFLST